jgi:diadenylate cyclase
MLTHSISSVRTINKLGYLLLVEDPSITHFMKFNLLSFVDILVVAILIYLIFTLLRGTIALSIFIGICIVGVFYLTVKTLHMELLTGILDKFLSVGVIAVIIIFQQEIRRFLLLIGKNFTYKRARFWTKIFKSGKPDPAVNYDLIKPIIDACNSMKLSRTGALIILAKNFEEQVFQNNGEELNCKISKRVLESIFNKLSPLHDGAVVIYDGQIRLASCILPITDNMELPVHLGLRHRAGIGITEHSDSVAFIVSEETGDIAFSKEGKIRTNISLPELERILHTELTS